MKSESFVFGKGSIPKWFKDSLSLGRVKMINDEDDEVIGAKIFYPTKVIDVKIGDVIVLTKSGLVVSKGKDKVKDEDKTEEDPN